VGQRLEFAIGLPLFADVERQSTREHGQRCNHRHAGQAQQGLSHAVEHVDAQSGGRCIDIVEINARAQHPAPARQCHCIAELAFNAVAGGLGPQVALVSAALTGACDQLADHIGAVAVTHVPQVLAYQLGLTRMHESQAFIVVDVKIAVIAKVHARQNSLGLLLRSLVIASGAVKVLDRRQGQRDIAAEFVTLCADQYVFQQLRLLAFEPLGFEHQQSADRHDRQQQRCYRQRNDFCLEFHGPIVRLADEPGARTKILAFSLMH